jgi:hypothetical protein
MYSANILIANFASNVEILRFQNFSIQKVTFRNWEQVKQKFPGYQVFHNDTHHYIQRDYGELLPHPEDRGGLGSIPFDSEDLMLLLRLFKPGDICFVGQVVHTPAGPRNQYRYPQVFSEVPYSSLYTLQAKESAFFDAFCAAALTWPGWKSVWFKVSRRYFLWGSSKEFNVTRERIGDWELERILDFYIALEAAIVPEHDYVGRRLRERAAVLLNLSADAAVALKQRFRELYGVRSTVAHGGILKPSQADTLPQLMPAFEQDVRDLLKATLQHSPRDEGERRNWLKSLSG